MLRDLVIVGAGPVGATLALALRDADLDIVALDARPHGAIARGDRSLALSHGTRLMFERLGIWGEVASIADAVTPIVAIDISQRGGFGHVRLDAAEHALPALGYVVSYRALQSALDSALARTRIRVEHDVDVTRADATPAFAEVRAKRLGEDIEWTTRLAAVADGGGDVVSSLKRRRHDYRQVALVAQAWTKRPHSGIAFERFTPEGPMALLPEGDHYGMVWTAAPERARELVDLPETEFLAALAACFGSARRRLRARERPAQLSACRSISPSALSASALCWWATRRKLCIPLRARVSISVFAMPSSWRKSCLRRRAIKLVRKHVWSSTRAAAAPIDGPAFRLRMDCSESSARTRRCCAGREGWRLLCSTHCRR